MNYTYRDITPIDFEQVCHLPQNDIELFYCFPKTSYPLTVTQLKRSIIERWDPTVFLYNEQIVGYANIIKVEFGQWGSIGNIVVSPSIRGKGLGRYILDVMSGKLNVKYGINEIRLACFADNIHGLLLYHQYGFKPYAMETRMNNQADYLMLLHLKKGIK